MSNDTAFSGSIPAIYDDRLGPLLFRPYAEEVARRIAALQPGRILETAAGTGVVTQLVRQAVPDAQMIATDLNPAMLQAAAKRLGTSSNVQLIAADAQQLPFPDSSFDLVFCQFGIMFYPDKVRGNREARRVLREGGTLLLVIWDTLDRNPVSRGAQDAVAALFEADPPSFFRRVPFAYTDEDAIRTDLIAAGFRTVDIEVVERSSRVDAEQAAEGLVLGTPMRAELEERGADLDAVVAAVSTALRPWDGKDGQMSARIVTATR